MKILLLINPFGFTARSEKAGPEGVGVGSRVVEVWDFGFQEVKACVLKWSSELKVWHSASTGLCRQDL